MDKVFCVAGHIRDNRVEYGYYKTESSALAGLEKQAESFSSKGFTVEHREPIPTFNECGEILIYDGAELYGIIRVKSNILND